MEKQRTYLYKGDFYVRNGLVDVSDPCYDLGTWCAEYNVRIRDGVYLCYVVLGENDTRIASMAIVHMDYEKAFGADVSPEILNNEIGVDAGLAGFFLSPKPEYKEDHEWHAFCEKLKGCGYPTIFVDEKMFVCSSGWGDGAYPLYATRNKEGEIVALEIVFIEEE